MISVMDIQSAYNNLYTEMRKYIWDFDTVSKLVDLEISAYQTMPCIEDIKRNIDKLRQDTREAEKANVELKDAFDKFSELIESDDTPYKKLYQVDEVIDL